MTAEMWGGFAFGCATTLLAVAIAWALNWHNALKHAGVDRRRSK